MTNSTNQTNFERLTPAPLSPIQTEQEITVHLQNVGKQYGKRWAIQDINLTLHAGEILGFIGPNGAGKTTLMKLIAGLSAPSTGTITVLGQFLSKDKLHTPAGIGLVLEQLGFIPYLSGLQNLEILANLHKKITKPHICATLERVGLDPTDRRPVKAYSLGMRQRLAIAQAIMEKPRLLLLDEPTNGLDPAGIVSLRELLKTIATQGTTIFLASHLLTEVEQLCDRVILVREGKIVREIISAAPAFVRVRLEVSSFEDGERLIRWAKVSNSKVETPISLEIEAERENQLIFYLNPAQPISTIIKRLVLEADINLQSVNLVKESLETAFMNLLK